MGFHNDRARPILGAEFWIGGAVVDIETGGNVPGTEGGGRAEGNPDRDAEDENDTKDTEGSRIETEGRLGFASRGHGSWEATIVGKSVCGWNGLGTIEMLARYSTSKNLRRASRGDREPKMRI